MTELDLLNRYAHDRDAEAFAQLVDCYQRLILSTCRRRLHDAADLDDAVQETFLRMAKAAGTLRNNVGAWLHRCAVNVSTDYNRRRDARLRHESQAVQNPAASAAQQELAELREHLDAALEKLDTSERELIVRRFFIGRSQVELASEAGVAPSTISVRLNQAIEHLRDHLKGAGCAIVAGALVEALQKEAASAAMPPELAAKVARVGLSGIAAASGSLVMLSLALLFLLIFTAAVGFWIWRGTIRQHTTPAVAAKPTTPPPPTMALTVDTGHGAVPSSPTWKPAVNAPPSGALSGTVTDRQGKPIAGARVSLNGFTVTTNPQGQYVFGARAVTNGDNRLMVSAPGYQ
jgi:RNA polymerase sigma-70 factor (ECF subfamily)